MVNSPHPQTRHLEWEGCYNVRDLGGLATADGRQTRRGAIIRSDLPGRLTANGRQALLEYGVGTIIDLRAPWQAAEAPSARFTDEELAPTYLNRPLEKYTPHVGALIEKAETRAEVYCIVLDYYPDNTAEALRAVAAAGPGGVLIHCHSGTDRTGIISALLLRLAGVPAEVVAADYALSQQRLWPLYEQRVADEGGQDMISFWSLPMVRPQVMVTMLDHLDGRYGGVAGYLAEAGLTAAEMDRLRLRLCP